MLAIMLLLKIKLAKNKYKSFAFIQLKWSRSALEYKRGHRMTECNLRRHSYVHAKNLHSRLIPNVAPLIRVHLPRLLFCYKPILWSCNDCTHRRVDKTKASMSFDCTGYITIARNPLLLSIWLIVLLKSKSKREGHCLPRWSSLVIRRRINLLLLDEQETGLDKVVLFVCFLA